MQQNSTAGLSPAFPGITLRFVWAIVTVASIVIIGTFLHAALVLAEFAGIVVAGLLVADIALGPGRGTLGVEREPVEHLSLRSPAHLRYRLTNASGVPLRYEVLDTPLDALDLPEAPVSGGVGADLTFFPHHSNGPMVFAN